MARTASRAVAGFFAAPPEVIPLAAGLLDLGPGEHAVLDPCAGEGAAAFALAARSGRATRADLARAACLVVAAALAIAIGAWLSPGIAELHRGGAVRHVGAAGAELERLHHLAELLAKGEIALLLAAFGLSVARASRPSQGTPP